MKTTTINNLEIINKAYEEFAKGNVPAVLELFDSNIEWDECTGFPYVVGDGIYKGPQEVMEKIFSQIPVYIDGFNIEIRELLHCGEKVMMVGYYKGTWKETNKEFKANATHTWTLKNGNITHFFQAVDTATIMN